MATSFDNRQFPYKTLSEQYWVSALGNLMKATKAASELGHARCWPHDPLEGHHLRDAQGDSRKLMKQAEHIYELYRRMFAASAEDKMGAEGGWKMRRASGEDSLLP